jgi:hypothetical protein
VKEVEMAKKKNIANENTCGVLCKEGKYFCVDCGTELKIDHDCPQCRKQIDWERALVELKRPTL